MRNIRLTEDEETRKGGMEYSKRITVVIFAVSIAILVFSCVMIWRTEDLSPLIPMIGFVEAVTGVTIAFYYNKAKAENKIKLMKYYKVKPDKDSFNE